MLHCPGHRTQNELHVQRQGGVEAELVHEATLALQPHLKELSLAAGQHVPGARQEPRVDEREDLQSHRSEAADAQEKQPAERRPLVVHEHAQNGAEGEAKGRRGECQLLDGLARLGDGLPLVHVERALLHEWGMQHGAQRRREEVAPKGEEGREHGAAEAAAAAVRRAAELEYRVDERREEEELDDGPHGVLVHIRLEGLGEGQRLGQPHCLAVRRLRSQVALGGAGLACVNAARRRLWWWESA
mmetsp:Transcript_11390/g.34539  ORF Transcript_11390/g.34539 Transcript_11390/m.34539 type:complete len:244 (-) Transcript_11390:191-922(-)